MPSPDMSRYIDLTPLDTDPAVIYNGAIELARLTMPEFTLRQGTPEDAIFQAAAYVSAITAGAINRLPSALMVGLANLLGYTRFAGSKATVQATLTLASYDAAIIPSGTILSWTHEDDNGEIFQYAFEVIDNVDISAGTPPTLPTGTASLRSLVPGYMPTIPVGSSLNILTTNTAIQSAVTTNSFVPGQDPESNQQYLDSIATYMGTLSSSISTGSQLDSTVLLNFRNVGRCKTYDLTDPSGDLKVTDPDIAGYATVFVYGLNALLTSTDRSGILALVEDRLNIGLSVDVLDITLCGISVRASVAYDDTWPEADVIDSIEYTIRSYLSPSKYPSFESNIRGNSVLSMISRVSGVLYVSSVALQPIQTAGSEVWNEKQWADVRLATNAALPTCTYANGSGGVGATLTASSNGALSIDSTSVAAGNRILVKNQSTGTQNGIYTVTNAGGVSAAWVLTRATDADAPAEFAQNKVVYVLNGTANGATYWKQTTTGAVTTSPTWTTSLAFGSGAAHQNLTFIYKGSMPDISLGTIDLTMTSETI